MGKTRPGLQRRKAALSAGAGKQSAAGAAGYWTNPAECGIFGRKREGRNVVAKAQVLSALVPWLGSALALRLDDAVEAVTRRLNAWSPRMDP